MMFLSSSVTRSDSAKDYASKINILQMHDIAVLRNNGAFAAGAFRCIDMVITAVSGVPPASRLRAFYKTRPAVQVVPNGVRC